MGIGKTLGQEERKPHDIVPSRGPSGPPRMLFGRGLPRRCARVGRAWPGAGGASPHGMHPLSAHGGEVRRGLPYRHACRSHARGCRLCGGGGGRAAIRAASASAAVTAARAAVASSFALRLAHMTAAALRPRSRRSSADMVRSEPLPPLDWASFVQTARAIRPPVIVMGSLQKGARARARRFRTPLSSNPVVC